MKKILVVILAALAINLAACNEADIVSHNLSQEADQFNVLRRVVFYNGITDQYMLNIEGYCSLGNDRTADEISITCLTGTNDKGEPVYKKHFLGLSDNVTYFIEQLDSKGVSASQYKVIFKPATIVPDVEIDE